MKTNKSGFYENIWKDDLVPCANLCFLKIELSLHLQDEQCFLKLLIDTNKTLGKIMVSYLLTVTRFYTVIKQGL